MSSPGRFHEFEHAGWQRAAGRYHATFQELTRQSAPALLDAVRARGSTRLLDVCTGPGYVLEAAVERGAELVGVDFSSEMLGVASARCPQAELHEGNAEELAFPDGSFDAVVMNYGLLHLERPERALAEGLRVLRPSGRFACTVWALPERARGFGLVLDAIRAHGTTEVDLPPGPDFFRFSDPDECRRSFAAVGFEDVEVREVPQTWRVARPEEVFETMLEGTVRTGGLLRAQSPEALSSIRASIAEAVREHEDGGAFELPMPAVLTVGSRPAGAD